MEARSAFGPTPTPTATRQPNTTATPDFRATCVAEDFAIQQAYQAALLGTPPATATPMDAWPDDEFTATPTPLTILLPGLSVPGTVTPVPDEPQAVVPDDSPLATPSLGATPALPETSTPTNAPNNVIMPIIVGDSPLSTPTGQVVAVAPTLPPAPEPPTSAPPSPTPTFTPLPVIVEEPPTPTSTPAAPTVTPPPTPTSVIYQVSSLRGVFGDQGLTRIGPSNIYSSTTRSAPRGNEVRLLGRNPSGEWVYFCCLLDSGNEPAWVRQTYAPPSGNTPEPNAPEDINADDVRWLPIQPALPSLEPLPQPIPAGPNDFTMARVDRCRKRARGCLAHPTLYAQMDSADRPSLDICTGGFWQQRACRQCRRPSL